MALPKQFRLKRKDVRDIFKDSRRFSTAIGVFFLKQNGLKASRFGFAAPISVSKKSNARNKIRRMAAERVRIGFQDITAGFDVLVIFKKEAAGFAKKEFYEKLEEAFMKSGILNP